MTPCGETIPELFASAVDTFADSVYLQLRQGDTMLSESYGQVARDVLAITERIQRAGYVKGDRIGLLSENSADWVKTYLGILGAGCIVVPIDSLMPEPEIENVLKMASTRLLFCSERFFERFRDAGVACQVIQIGSLPDAHADVKGSLRTMDLTSNDIATIIFTSGTTGHSKGVVLTHGNLVSNVLACRRVCEIRHEDNFLLLLPLHHTFASTVTMLLPIATGARATIATSYRSRDVVDDIRVSRVTVLVGVPQIFENIKNSIERAVDSAPAFKRAMFLSLLMISRSAAIFGLKPGFQLFRSLRAKAGLDSVRLMVSGGAALPLFVNRFFENLGFTLIQGYGLTECSPVLSVNLPGRNKLGSVGPALPGVRLEIRNPNEFGIGEVCASGPNVMQGYFENPEASAQVLKDGWFYTGDAGYLDADGYLHLTGRIKNVIVTSAGKNVYPEELESKLAAHPAIAEALVLAVQRKDGKGEQLCAILKLDEEYLERNASGLPAEDIAAEAVKSFNRSSASYQSIREWRVLNDDFHKTSTRKIKRHLYRDFFK